jgi:hypothetical protein
MKAEEQINEKIKQIREATTIKEDVKNGMINFGEWILDKKKNGLL